MFKIAIITDEVSQDLATVISFASRFALEGLELRSLWEKGPFQFTSEEIGRIRKGAMGAGLRIPCVASPFFKCDYDDIPTGKAHMEGLKRCCDTAHLLGAGLIRGFSFWKKPGLALPQIAARFGPVAELLEKEGLTLVLEPDPAVSASNGRELGRLLALIGSPRVMALWDPGNIIFDREGEQPYPEGYEAVKPFLCHVHLKDARRKGGQPEAVLLGDGEVDLEGQFRRLAADGYSGWVSLEPHCRLDRALSQESLLLPGGEGFSHGGYQASGECAARFYRMLEQWGIARGGPQR